MATPGAQLPRILIVDDSRMVRASLGKSLRGRFDYREEGDGEAGWQVLVLDHTIELVLSDLSMPVLDGYGLLQRIRNSKLQRLRDLPVVMISGDEDETSRERARALGASDFVTKGIGTTELVARIESLIRLSSARRELEQTRDQQVQDPDSGLFTKRYVELQAAQALSHASRHNSEVSVLMLGFDNYLSLRDEAGEAVMRQLMLRFARLLGGKIRREDSLGHYGDGVFAVVSPGTPEAACVAFANRVREAIEVANIAAHGQRLHLSVSVGAANTPTDTVSSAGALLDLAVQRMRRAMQEGGNRVLGTQVRPEVPAKPLTLEKALEILRAGHRDAVRPQCLALGQQLLPLLRLIGEELDMALPVAELENRLLDRVHQQKDTRHE